MRIEWGGICLDCADAEELARFYTEVFGWQEVARDGSDWIHLAGSERGPGVSLQAETWYEPPAWPEQPGAPTKMMHFEVGTDDLDAAIALVLRAGGREASPQPADRDPALLRVMLDPAGHPFCLCLFGT
jgi:catechol 2,3-dioxygenase-like lactoylglutathione lyase family enzyme